MQEKGVEAVIEEFLQALREPGGFDFAYVITATEGDGDRRAVAVEFSGPDAPRMVERNGELLHAMESLAANILRLGPEEQGQVQFDALGFKRGRDEAIERLAEEGVVQVRETGRPYTFAPMNSRDRRMLHMELAKSGLQTASSGEGPRRFVVVYPEGMTPRPEQFAPAPGGTRASGPGGRPGYRDGSRSAGRVDFRRGRPGGGMERRRDGGGPVRGIGAPVERTVLPGERLQRLDPNGNPIEAAEPAEGAAALSERERLESLRRAFRKR